MKIVVVNGPNLNRLGKRQPENYGTTTLADIEKLVRAHADKAGVELDFVQSIHEGVLLDAVHAAADDNAAIIINPGAFTHTSVALRDALAEIADGQGYVEVHISNVHAREPFRRHSYLSDKARGVIAGLGAYGYVAALGFFTQDLTPKDA